MLVDRTQEECCISNRFRLCNIPLFWHLMGKFTIWPSHRNIPVDVSFIKDIVSFLRSIHGIKISDQLQVRRNQIMPNNVKYHVVGNKRNQKSTPCFHYKVNVRFFCRLWVLRWGSLWAFYMTHFGGFRSENGQEKKLFSYHRHIK